MMAETSLSTGVAAPPAPGALGVPVTAGEAQTYLRAMREWVGQRKADLDAVDAAALKLTPAEQTSVTSDLTVALAFWKAANDRLVLLETTFDGGRVGPEEAQRLSTLIHGRLDSTTVNALSLPSTGSLAVSLPEACRLLDSLTRTLQARVSLAPGALESSQRIVLVRATLERVRDQVPLVPAGEPRDTADGRLTRLDRRLADLVERAARGADVGGLVGPLEVDAAVLERDLIVAAAERVESARDRASTERRAAELQARAAAIGALEQACVLAVAPAPRLAIPDVRRLGPVPQAGAELTAYRQRLDRVAQALDLAHQAYAGALAERDEVAGLAGAVGAMAAGLALTGPAAGDLADLRDRVEEALGQQPVPIDRARALVDAYRSYVDTMSRRKARP